eukprot:3379570-Prymnesium_polylepis.1
MLPRVDGVHELDGTRALAEHDRAPKFPPDDELSLNKSPAPVIERQLGRTTQDCKYRVGLKPAVEVQSYGKSLLPDSEIDYVEGFYDVVSG